MRLNISNGNNDFGLNSFQKINFQKVSYLKCIRKENLTLTSPMLHTKSQGRQPSGSERIFNGLLPYMGMSAILVM